MWSMASRPPNAGIALLVGMLICVMTIPSALSEKIMLDMLVNQDPKEISSISAECNEDGERMTCRFVQVQVDRDLTAEERANLVAARFWQLRDEIKKSGGSSRCQSTGAPGKPVSHEAIVNPDAEEAAYQQELARLTQRACANPSDEALRELADWLVRGEQRNCNIAIYRPYEVVFLRRSERVWVNETEPQGLCGYATISTLQQNDENAVSWTYTAETIVRNPDAGDKLGNPFASCRGVHHEGKIVFSTQNASFLRKCARIRFGA